MSQSTPLVYAGVVTTNTDKTIRSNPSDGTFSLPLAAGNYRVTISSAGQSTSFNIAVPDGGDTASIETLVTTPLVYPYVAPTALWNGQRAGQITFIPTATPPAPTSSEITYAGGNIDSGSSRYSYWVSCVTATGETNLSPQLAVSYQGGSPQANMATRVATPANPTGVTGVRLWRTIADTGHAYDLGSFPNGIGLLATLSPAAEHYDDWESPAQFAARVDATILSPLFNTTAGVMLSSNGTVCACISDQGLAVPSQLTVQAGASFPGSNLRFTQGAGLEIYNFDTAKWHTLLCTGSPAQLGLSTGHN